MEWKEGERKVKGRWKGKEGRGKERKVNGKERKVKGTNFRQKGRALINDFIELDTG